MEEPSKPRRRLLLIGVKLGLFSSQIFDQLADPDQSLVDL
jgi:hypothetical protein